MKAPRRLLALAALLVPLAAFAHPGHDGEHDITWDFGHFISHPLATLACLAVVAAAGWCVWRLLRSPTREKQMKVGRDGR